MDLKHAFSAFLLVLVYAIGVGSGRQTTKQTSLNRAGWVRPAETVNQQTERFDRLYKRLNEEGHFELVWLDADGRDGLEEPPTPEIVTARVP